MLEAEVLACPDIQEGLNFGEVRDGHPEGAVQNHVQEIWNMMTGKQFDFYGSRVRLTVEEYEILRFLALVHDTFKFEVDMSRAQHGRNHHGWFARCFAEEYAEIYFPNRCREIICMVRWHDEPYNIFSRMVRVKDFNDETAKRRVGKLLNGDIHDWRLFLYFVYLDGHTGDKTGKSVDWFAKLLKNRGLV